MLNVQQYKKKEKIRTERRVGDNNNARLGRCPTAGDIDPFGQAASLLSFNVDDIRVTFAAAAHSVLFNRVGYRPVVVFLKTLLLVFGRRFEVWDPR